MTFPLRNVRRRDGLTLVELLVVVTILVMLVGVTIPLMKSVRSGSQLEAAVRKIESVMRAAKARAITNGRPAGVVFIRDTVNPTIAYELALAESPPPYAGEFTGPKKLSILPGGVIQFEEGVRPLRPEKRSNEMTDPSNDETKWFVRPGDLIRFNFQGKYHVIRSVTNQITISLNEQIPTGTRFMEFQIFRSPRRTLAAPVELPQGAFVKLSSCGIALDHGGNQLDPLGRLFSFGNVTVTFNSAGRMDKVYRGSPIAPDKAWADELIQQNLVSSPEEASRSYFRITRPLRIDLGDGSPLSPTNAHRLVLHNREDRNSKSIVVAQMDQ